MQSSPKAYPNAIKRPIVTQNPRQEMSRAIGEYLCQWVEHDPCLYGLRGEINRGRRQDTTAFTLLMVCVRVNDDAADFGCPQGLLTFCHSRGPWVIRKGGRVGVGGGFFRPCRNRDKNSILLILGVLVFPEFWYFLPEYEGKPFDCQNVIRKLRLATAMPSGIRESSGTRADDLEAMANPRIRGK